MSATFTRDGKTVEYDEMEDTPELRWVGDPHLIGELMDALAQESVTLGEPGLTITFQPDNPLYNVTAAAMALGFDTIGAEGGTPAADEVDALRFPTIFDELEAEGVTTSVLTESELDDDQWEAHLPVDDQDVQVIF